jgi:carboxyl-terminal processing protease
VRAGDIIDTIDGESTEPMSLDDAITHLKGPKDSPVVITLLRAGAEESIEMTVIRAEIPQTTVRYSYMMTPDVGYMRISDFNRGTGDEVRTELAALRAQGMKRLLLDLRNNGGGLLDQAIEVGEQFVPRGGKIVETRGRIRSSFQTFVGNGPELGLDLPVVVLVNGGTASAAEIVAGAIQDHDVGVVTGIPTWGKGLVQTVYSLSYGAGLVLTTARYYTPSGRLIQRDYSSYYDYYAYNPLGGQTHVTEGDEAVETEPSKDGAFATDLGRKVFSGGGITPDVYVEPEPLSPFEQTLLAQSAFFNFGVEYLDRHPVKSESWQPPEGVLADFREWLVKKKIGDVETLDQDLAKDKDSVVRQIRAEVFNAAFGQNAWHRALSAGDPQVQAALGLFDQAAELLKNRQQLIAEHRGEVDTDKQRSAPLVLKD